MRRALPPVALLLDALLLLLDAPLQVELLLDALLLGGRRRNAAPQASQNTAHRPSQNSQARPSVHARLIPIRDQRRARVFID